MPLRDSHSRNVAVSHLISGKCESWKIVPAVTLNWYWHSAHHSSLELVCRRTTLSLLQRMHSGPLGQRTRSSNSRHRAAVENTWQRSTNVMANAPKKQALQRVPMRKLLASVKQDIRRQLRASASAKPKKPQR